MNGRRRKPPFYLLDKQKIIPAMPGGGCVAQWYFIHMLCNLHDGGDDGCLELLRVRNRNFPSTPDLAVRRARYAFEKTFSQHLPDALEASAAVMAAKVLRRAHTRGERVWQLFEAQRLLGCDSELAWLCRAARLIAAHCKEIDETAAGCAAYLLAWLAELNPDAEDGFLLPFDVFYEMNCIGAPHVRDVFADVDSLFGYRAD